METEDQLCGAEMPEEEPPSGLPPVINSESSTLVSSGSPDLTGDA